MKDIDFYVVYDVKTMEMKSVGPVLIEVTDPNRKIHKIRFSEIADLQSSPKLFDHRVDVSQEYAKILESIPYNISRSILDLDRENIVQDLNYRNFFFEKFNITVHQENNEIILTIDLTGINKLNFETMITEETGITELYFTKFRDPTELYFKQQVDLNLFKHSPEIRIPGIDKKVSVWATRKS